LEIHGPVALLSYGRSKIRNGNANIRNPILVSYVAKGLLPYHGLGSGIKRALAQWPRIDFDDDRDGCLFIATIHRKPMEKMRLSDKGAIKVEKKESECTYKCAYKCTFKRHPDAVAEAYSVNSCHLLWRNG
jgi:hypothetical protein